MWKVVLVGAAALAASVPASAKDMVWTPGAQVEFQASVTAVREVPVGNPLPGLHLDAKVKGRMVDIYVAPMNFIAKYKVRIDKGDEVRVRGTAFPAADVDRVLAQDITTGSFDMKSGNFRDDTTIYLRNANGALWDEGPTVIELIDGYSK